jgi:hypothetical protein
MATIDPNRPGYYTDGTPVPGYSAQSAKPPGYPIGMGISGTSIPFVSPSVAQTASAIRAASADPSPIYKQGNPYNAQRGRMSYITASNKTSNTPTKGAYTYYGVPTLASRSQTAQQELQQKQLEAQIQQWQSEFAEQQRQNLFNNGISEGTLTGYYNGKPTIFLSGNNG